MEAHLTLSEHPCGTQVRWTGDLVELGGLLRMVPRGMLQTAALKTIDDLWSAVRQDLAG